MSLPQNEVRQSRCEFPGCRCRCMQPHSVQDICVRCLHTRAWHCPIVPQVTVTDLEPPESIDPPPTRATSPVQRNASEEQQDEIRSQQRIIDNLMMLMDMDASEQANKCCVCMNKPCDVVLKPCGHARFCRQCMNNQTVTECPLCRTQIRNKVSFIPL